MSESQESSAAAGSQFSRSARAILTFAALILLSLCISVRSASAQTSGTDYFMLLDASGSMGTNDPQQISVLATEIVDALLNDADRLWVGRHADARVVWELAEVDDGGELRERLFRRVVREVKNTDCQTGLQLTAQAIERAHRDDPSRKQVILALGDGNCVGDEDTPNYADFVEPLMSARPDVPVLFVGLSDQARAACDGLEQLPRQNEQIFVHCVNEPLPQNSQEKSLVSAFVDVFRVGLGLSEVVEASSDDPRMSGCLASSRSKLLVMSDREVAVALIPIDADGSETQAQSVTVTAQSPSVPFGGIAGRATLYTYHVLEFETDAAQVEVRVSPADARWRAIFVPIVDDGGDNVNARTPRVTGDGCTDDAVWREGRGTPPRFSTTDSLCFDARLFGRCGGSERDVRMRVHRDDGTATDELKLSRTGNGNRFWTANEDFQCTPGKYSAQVIANSVGSAGVSEVSVALAFECESCRLAGGSRAAPEVSWCQEEARRSAAFALPLADECQNGVVTLPALPAPYDHCATWSVGEVKRLPDGGSTVDVQFTLTPDNEACDIDALSEEPAVTVPVPGGEPVTLAPSFYDPLDELVLRSTSDDSAVGYNRCSPNDNFGHLSLDNRGSCAIDIDAVRMSVMPESGEMRTVPLAATAGDSVGEHIEAPDEASVPIEPGNQLSLGGLQTTRPLCGLSGTRAASVSVIDVWGRRANAGASNFAFAPRAFNTKDWWICNALLARSVAVALIALCLILLLLIGVLGYPPVRRQVRLTPSLLPEEQRPGRGQYYSSFGAAFGHDERGIAKGGNSWIARFFTGKMRYDLRLVTEHLSKSNRTVGGGAEGESIQTEPIVRRIDETFERGWSSREMLTLDDVQPNELIRTETDLDHVGIKAGFHTQQRRGLSREALALSMGRTLHRIRIPVWVLLVLGLFMFWLVERMLAAAC